MNLFYNMELLRCYRFSDLTFHLFGAILKSDHFFICNMIKMYSLLSLPAHCKIALLRSIFMLHFGCVDKKEKIVND